MTTIYTSGVQEAIGITISAPLYPKLDPALNDFYIPVNEDPSLRPPPFNPAFKDNFPHSSPSFDSSVNSIHALTLPTQIELDPLVSSTHHETLPFFSTEIYPKLADNFSSYFFTEDLTALPPIVPEEFKAPFPVLPTQFWYEINELTASHFVNFNPWQVSEDHPIHALIGKIMNEIVSKFSKEASHDAFLNELALCEKAIFEIEQLPTIDQESKKKLEIGLRDAFSKHIEIFEANKLGETYQKTGLIPNYIEIIPACLQQFATRGGYYKPSYIIHHGGELLTSVRYHFCQALNANFNQLNVGPLTLDQHLSFCNALIKQMLQGFDATPNVKANLEFDAHQTMTTSLHEHYAPLFKQAYETGQPLPCDLSQLLDSFYNLASNNNYLILDQDPRKTFIEAVFGTDNVEVLRNTCLEQQRTQPLPSQPPIQPPRGIWSKLNIFSKQPTKVQLENKNELLKINQQLEIIDQLEVYMTRGQGNGLFASAPTLFEETKLYPDLDTSSLDVKTAIPLLIHTSAQTQAPSKVTMTFPALPKKSKPTGSYVHLAFRDLLERTTDDKDLYEQFPKPVQRDLMRHLFNIRIIGPAEQRIETAFKRNVDGKTVPHINHLYRRELEKLDKQLKSEQKTPKQLQGEEILQLYYQGKQNDKAFLEKLDSFPASKLFLYYVWEIAKNANVEMLDTETDWARNRYKDPEFIHLTMQALERFLHTS